MDQVMAPKKPRTQEIQRNCWTRSDPVKPARAKQVDAAAPSTASYPPGYFTEPVRQWLGEGWRSQMDADAVPNNWGAKGD